MTAFVSMSMISNRNLRKEKHTQHAQIREMKSDVIIMLKSVDNPRVQRHRTM